MRPVVILGFGRSGTTWVADILSRASNRLVLFEPIHPKVMSNCADYAYQRILPGDRDAEALVAIYHRILTKRLRKPWLLRNHVSVPLDDVPPETLEELWRDHQILGTKEIRGNFLAPLLRDQLDAALLYIVRDPRAVVASIVKRKSFWEFGFPGTFDLFIRNTVLGERFASHPVAKLRRLALAARTDIEKITTMWALTQAVALEDMRQLGAPVIRYEDLHNAPSFNFSRIFGSLGISDAHLDQKQIYQPSVTTEKKLTDLYQNRLSDTEGELNFFWDEVFTPETAEQILTIAADFGVDMYSAPCERFSASA